MKQAKDHLIFALDLPEPRQAEALARRLAPHVGLFKVGLELFAAAGPQIVTRLRSVGAAGVFLDLKLHDIPVTVERTVVRIAELGVELATVHCAGGQRMLAAAVRGGRGRVGIIGVTLLTSLSGADLKAEGWPLQDTEGIGQLVAVRARRAAESGCAGIVCSGREVAAVKRSCGAGFLAVTPGIRSAGQGEASDDQRRVVTAAEAIENGADYLVVGRPIRDAADPVAAAVGLTREIEAALQRKKARSPGA